MPFRLNRSIFKMFWLVLSLGISFQLHSQTTEFSPGNPTASAMIPVESGFINLANGNLHLDIPFATYNLRGGLVRHAGFVYDSSIWHGVTNTGGSRQWMPNNVLDSHLQASWGGWRYADEYIPNTGFTTFPQVSGKTTCSSDGSGYVQQQALQWTDGTGTTHTFPVETITVSHNIPGCIDGAITDTPSSQGYASDGSGYYAVVTNYTTVDIWNPAGTHVVNGTSGSAAIPRYIDRNGNYEADDYKDDLGREIPGVASTSSPYYYDVLTTYGKTVRYTVTTETIQLKTNFLADSVGSDFTGSMTVVQSIGLPDGSSYSFTYEPNYGELTSIKLPHGGVISYKYTSGLNGTRAGENVPPRWVSQHVGANGTTTFSILPTQCPGNNSPDPCTIQDNYVTRSGSTTDYTFTLQKQIGNSYLNTKIVTHSGDKNSAVVSTITKTYDLSNQCPAYYCSPSNPKSDPYSQIVWPNLKTVLTSLANGLSSYTKYNTYAAPGSGIPLDVQQWDYYASTGAPPSNPTPTRRSISTVTTYMNGVPLIGEVDRYDATGAKIAQLNRTYDEASNVTQSSGVPNHEVIPGPHGNLTTSTVWWDTYNRSLSTHYYYDDAGALLAVVDPKTNKTAYSYDSTDTFVTGVKYPPVGSTQLSTGASFDYSSGQLLSVTDANKKLTSYTYDSVGRLQTVARPDGGSTTVSYPSVNEVDLADLQSPGATVDSTSIVDAFGRPSSTTVGGTTSSTTYDAQGRVLCSVTPHGASTSSTDGQTCYGYDSLDRPMTITQPDLNTVQLAYVGNTLTTTDELQHKKMYAYDAFGDIATVTEPDLSGALNWVTAYQYNGFGLLSQIDQKGGTTDNTQWRTRHYSYDSLGHLKSRTSPEAGSETLMYDDDGNVSSSTDAAAHTVSYSYDAMNRLQTKTIAGGAAYTYKYDAQDQSGDSNGAGQLTSVSNGSNVGLYLTHDVLGRLASQKYCLPSDCSYVSTLLAGYDFHGNPTSLVYPDGRAIGMTYDAQDRLTGETYAAWNGQSVNVPYFGNGSYYPTGQLENATYGNGVQLSTGVSNRLTLNSLTYSLPAGSTLLSKSYTWDANALTLHSITDNISKGVRTFSYDPLNRLTSANDTGSPSSTPGTGSVTMSGTEQAVTKTVCTIVGGIRRCTPETVYDTGTVTIVVGSISQSVSYGGASNPVTLASALVSTINGNASSPVTASSNAGQVTLTAKSGGSSSDYSMTASVTTSDPADFPSPSFSSTASGGGLAGGSTGPILSVSYTPDAWGNLKQSGTFSFIQNFDLNNRIAAQGYVYDAAGHLTQDGLGNGYAYDAAGRITGSNGATYTYDGLDNRVRKDSGGGALEYYYFGGRLMATRNPSGGAWTDYIYAGGRLIAENAGIQTACATFRLGDHLDSLSKTSDCGGNTVGANDFSPYGQLVDGDAQSLIQFTDHEFDRENGTDHTLFRQFDPAQGRWITPDPSGASYDLYDPQSLNRYAYVRNRPTAASDPDGLNWFTDQFSFGDDNDADDRNKQDPLYQSDPSLLNPNFTSDFSFLDSSTTLTYTSTATITDVRELPVNLPSSNALGILGSIIDGALATKDATSSANQQPCGTSGFGGGVLVGYGGSLDAGAGVAGVTGTGSASGGLFYGSGNGVSAGAAASGGTAAYALGNVAGAPTQTGQPFSLGAYAGAGPNITFTNARSVQQLAGPFKTLTLNVGFGLVKGSLQLSFANGIWEFSIGPPVPFVSPGVGGSVSKVTTNTITTKTGCRG